MALSKESSFSYHFSLSVAAEVSLIILSFISGIITSRYLGPQGRGEYAIVVLWPSIFAAFGSLGVRESLAYLSANRPGLRSKLNGAAIILIALQSIILSLVGYWLIPILTSRQSAAVALLSRTFLFYIPLNLCASYFGGILQGAMKIFWFNLLRVSLNVIYVFFLLALWYVTKITVYTVTVAMLWANFITALLAVSIGFLSFRVQWKLALPFYKYIFLYGLKNHVGSVSNWFNQRVDQMLMAVWLSPAQLGWYIVAVNTSNLVKTFSLALAQLAFPSMASAQPDQQARIASRYSRYALLASSISAVTLWFLLPMVIPWIYGVEFLPSILPAQILVAAAFFSAMSATWSANLRGAGRPASISIAEAIGFIVTLIGLSLTLVAYQAIGAAWVSLISYVLSASYLAYCMVTYLHLDLFSLFLNIPAWKIIEGKGESHD